MAILLCAVFNASFSTYKSAESKCALTNSWKHSGWVTSCSRCSRMPQNSSCKWMTVWKSSSKARHKRLSSRVFSTVKKSRWSNALTLITRAQNRKTSLFCNCTCKSQALLKMLWKVCSRLRTWVATTHMCMTSMANKTPRNSWDSKSCHQSCRLTSIDSEWAHQVTWSRSTVRVSLATVWTSIRSCDRQTATCCHSQPVNWMSKSWCHRSLQEPECHSTHQNRRRDRVSQGCREMIVVQRLREA